MRRAYAGFILGAAILALAGGITCSRTIQGDDAILGDRTRLPENNADVTRVLVGGNALTLVCREGATKPAYSAGDILVGQSETGYLRKVRSTTTRGDTLFISTEQAELTDALEKCSVDTTFGLVADSVRLDAVRSETTFVGTDGGGSHMLVEADGAQVVPLAGGRFEVRIPNMRIELTDNSGRLAVSFSCDTVILSKNVDVDLGVRIAASEVKEFWLIGQLEEETRFRGVRVTVSGSLLSKEIERKLHTVHLGKAVVMAGPVPIVFFFEMGIYAGLGADASVSVTAEILSNTLVTTTTSAGAHYKDRAWQAVYEKILTGSATLGFTPVTASVEAQGFLKGSLDTKVYGVAGPTLFAKPYLYAEMSAPPPSLELGVGLAAGLGFKVEVFSKKLAEFVWTFADFRKALAETTFVGGTTVWSDGFEGYLAGEWPTTNWTNSGNSEGYIDNAIARSGTQSLRLYGVVGSYWGALAHRALGATSSWTVECYLRTGAEPIPSGGHQNRASLDLHVEPHWSSGARSLISFHKDGHVYGPGGQDLGTYQTLTWYKVTVKYEYPVADQVRLTYWINDVQAGQEDFAPASYEGDLAYIALTAQAGSVWYDDVSTSR
ncbi:MAG: hypothetical protein R6X13_12180 [bacterium]